MPGPLLNARESDLSLFHYIMYLRYISRDGKGETTSRDLFHFSCLDNNTIIIEEVFGFTTDNAVFFYPNIFLILFARIK